jgi:uncharacterized protein (DUF1810 family)
MSQYLFDHFLNAQANSFDNALDEIQTGCKKNHWIWFIFPQLKGLGSSDLSFKYGLSSLDEAKAYLAHPILGERLRLITSALLESSETNIHALLGYSDTDKLKLCSSMTLFYLAENTPTSIFKNVIDKYYGGVLDQKTSDILKINM